MIEPGRTWLDIGVAVYVGIGAAALVVAIPVYRSWSTVSGYSLALLGGIVVVTGLGYLLTRAALRERAT